MRSSIFVFVSLVVLLFSFGCDNSTTPTILSSSTAAEYLPSGEAGTIYTFNSTVVLGNQRLDTFHTKYSEKILARNYKTVLSDSSILIERHFRFLSSNSVSKDTVYRFAKDESVWQCAETPGFRNNNILVPISIFNGKSRVGDSLTEKTFNIFIGLVTSVDKQISVPYGTLGSVEVAYNINSTSVKMQDTLTYNQTVLSHYATNVGRVRIETQRKYMINGKVDDYEYQKLELASITKQ